MYRALNQNLLMQIQQTDNLRLSTRKVGVETNGEFCQPEPNESQHAVPQTSADMARSLPLSLREYHTLYSIISFAPPLCNWSRARKQSINKQINQSVICLVSVHLNCTRRHATNTMKMKTKKLQQACINVRSFSQWKLRLRLLLLVGVVGFLHGPRPPQLRHMHEDVFQGSLRDGVRQPVQLRVQLFRALKQPAAHTHVHYMIMQSVTTPYAITHSAALEKKEKKTF
jgi:hypothetical protein